MYIPHYRFSGRITASLTTWIYPPSMNPMAAYRFPHWLPSPRPTLSGLVLDSQVFLYPNSSSNWPGNHPLSAARAVLAFGSASPETEDSSQLRQAMGTSCRPPYYSHRANEAFPVPSLSLFLAPSSSLSPSGYSSTWNPTGFGA